MRKKQQLPILIGCLMGAMLMAEDFIDGIVAIVGDEIILYSELMQTTQGFAIQMGIDPQKQKDQMNTLKDEVLKNLISERVLLAKAEEDTITVEDQQVDTELENKIQEFIRQLGSRERVEAQFGMSIEKIKRDYRDEVRKQLIVQKVRMEKLQSVNVSRHEVEQFFLTMQDSLPERKPSVRMRHILINLKAGEETRQEAFDQIKEIQNQLLAGEDFEILAKKYSQDPGTASRGGSLGFVERGTLYPEFEEAAFNLEDGEISDIVETPVGFHIIQMIEKRGDRVNIRHILIRLETSEVDESKIVQTLQELKERARAGEDFAELAGKYSDDETTREDGGDLGWLPVDMLQIEQFKNLAFALKEGEISEPFKTPFGYHLVKMEEKKPARKLNLNDDYEDLKNMALNMKHQKILNEWIDELKKDLYIEIKEDILENQ
ncbi:peptidylprolyl isomerase [bacterium]|nr:peptidylprolyl isomerase [bacterium]